MWSSAASNTTEIDDADIERMFVIADYLHVECLSDSALLVIVDYLRQVRQSGPTRMVALCPFLLSEWGYFRDHFVGGVGVPGGWVHGGV